VVAMERSEAIARLTEHEAELKSRDSLHKVLRKRIEASAVQVF